VEEDGATKTGISSPELVKRTDSLPEIRRALSGYTSAIGVVTRLSRGLKLMPKPLKWFYLFAQNNSGGSFQEDDNVAGYVIIEAESANDANDKAEDVGIYFNGCADGFDCGCCGDRWYTTSDYEAYERPAIYGLPVAKYKTGFKDKCIIYRLDGSKKKIELSEGSNPQEDWKKFGVAKKK